MQNQPENFYFVQIGEVTRGPYPLRAIIDLLRDGRINLLTRCSADKVQWEPLRELLSRCNIEYSSIERNVKIKPDVPQRAAAPPIIRPVSVPPAAPAPAPVKNATAHRPLIVAVLGALWHPGDQLEAMSQKAGGAFGIALVYQILFSLLVTAGRGYGLLHRANAWKQLWFAPLETLAFFTAAFVIAGIFYLLTRPQEQRGSLLFSVIVALAMQGGTWGMTLFALFPSRFWSWKWCEWLAVVFLSLSFTWFSVLAAETMRTWSEKSDRGNRYTAQFFAVLMMLGVSAMIFYLIYLYKEF